MLSPAPLRVCCLAVMAPALTKADRRADCLPVVHPFCVQKTAACENRRDKFHNECALAKFPGKFAGLLKRKPLLNKGWFRACIRNGSESPEKYPLEPRKSPPSGRSRFNAEGKAWHGTSVTHAVADKVRLKYTMNKNSSSLRNMGLAKANTSLGLQSMRKINRFTPLSHNKSPSNHEAGESSPELPDATDSDLPSKFKMVHEPMPVHKDEEVITSTKDLMASSECETSPNLVSNMMESYRAEVANHTSVSLLTNNKIANDVHLISPTHPECLIDAEGRGTELTITPVLDSNSLVSFQPTTFNENSTGNKSIKEKSVESTLIPQLCTLLNCADNPCVTDVSDTKVTELHEPADEVSCVLPSDASAHVDNSETSVPDTSFSPPASPSSRFSQLDSDGETASFNDSFSSSSTLSADDSPLPSSFDEANDTVFITFPDCIPSPTTSLTADLPAHTLSDVSCLTPKSPLACDTVEDRMRKTCCPLTDKDYPTYKEMFLELEKNLEKALKETQILIRKQIVDHCNSQIRVLMRHLQKESGVSCQRQSRSSSNKLLKDVVDLKAELLQSEDVKNLSTAALVSLVRKLESNTSPGSLLSGLPQKTSIQDAEMLLRDSSVPIFSPIDCWDVRDTSGSMLKGLKDLIRCSDPDLTESSDDDASDVEMEFEDSAVQKRALWTFLKERASLSSRSTWLIARIHELENHLRTVTGVLKKLSSVGELCFEEQVVSEDSTFLTDVGSTTQSSAKQNKKCLGKTVNGYLDHNSSDTTFTAGRQVSGNHSDSDFNMSCSRTRALNKSSFMKRKLLLTTGLHLTNSKVAKLSTVGCVCNGDEDALPCVLCTGRYNCVQSVDPDLLTLHDRIALLDTNFHPLLSFEKDIPLLFHFENILKKNESQYQIVRPCSPTPSYKDGSYWSKSRHYSDSKSRNRKLNKYARSFLTSKYRNKKHFRKHKLVFGKWRKLQNKNSFHARDRIRRYSIASSGSSQDSPVASPLSLYDDGSGYDAKRKRDDNQFDIDDVIIPYSSKRGRLVKFEFKDIEIPSWRSKAFANLEAIDVEEDTSDEAFVQRHDSYEIEERKIIRNGGGALCFFNTWQKRARRQHRSDSIADSSGANTPDPILNCDQDMFQDPNSNPLSPVMSPPETPASTHISDDSQPPSSLPRSEKKRAAVVTRRVDEPSRLSTGEADEVQPYEPRVFPLSDELVDALLAESDHNRDDDVTLSGPSCPASPESTASSTSTLEDDDVTDPEWTVVKRDSGPEQPLVLKFAKR